MLFTSALVALSALVSSAMASPLAKLESRDVVTFEIVAKTADSRFNGLYLSAYHTGAGFNDVVLSPKSGVDFYLNNTAIETRFNGTANFPSGIDIAANTNYDEWYPVTLDSGYGTNGFEFNSQGELVITGRDADFYGWLVCKWAHYGIPQLFSVVVPDPVILHNCANVTLVKA